MANGKIIYIPLPSVALGFDGLHYLSSDNTAFNAGTGKFGVDVLGSIDPILTGVDCWFLLAAKGPADLANAAGWHFYYNPGRRRLGFRINDGGASPVVVETPDNVLPPPGEHFWARLQMDRAGLGQLFAQGLLAASGDISGKAGNVDSAEPFTVGLNHWGTIDLVRFDLGRLLSAAWHEEEWQRLRYGCFRRAEDYEDFLAVWTWYANSLQDLLGVYELLYQGEGSPVFEAGWPGSAADLEYLFDENFTFDMEPGYLDLDDNQRMADGSAFNCPAPNQKKSLTLPFQYIQPQQQAAFEAAWAAKQPIKLYLDADRPKQPGLFQIMKYPIQKSVFTNRVNAELDLEQI